jgi:hypothetical protein
MMATKNNVPPSSTLVITDLVPRNIPSSKNCTLRSPFASGAQSLHPTSCYFREYPFHALGCIKSRGA